MIIKFTYTIGILKSKKSDQNSPDHEYEEISRNKLNDIKMKKSCKTTLDNEVDTMEENVAYSIPTTTLMTMTDCEAYAVPKTHK